MMTMTQRAAVARRVAAAAPTLPTHISDDVN